MLSLVPKGAMSPALENTHLKPGCLIFLWKCPCIIPRPIGGGLAIRALVYIQYLKTRKEGFLQGRCEPMREK